jgi:DNA-binding MarR family transcriptional regulator
MEKVNEKIKFIINLAKAQSILVKRFEGGLGNGLGFNEFLILYYLNSAEDKKMRRVDLAEKISLTASGVTRLLLPMEKIGLVKSDENSDDARVRIIMISKSGQNKIEETLARFSDLIEEILSPIKDSEIKNLSNLLLDVAGKILMN